MSGRLLTEDGVWFDGAARLVACDRHVDDRGVLLPMELGQLPFVPRRLFTIAEVPAGAVRGGHAHRCGQQLLVCLQGQVQALLRRGSGSGCATLLPDGPGLLVGPGVWCQQTYQLPGSVLLVLASEPYDPGSYLETWDWR